MVSLVFYQYDDVCLDTYDCGTIIHLPSSRIKRPTCPLVVVAASDHGLLHILSTCMMDLVLVDICAYGCNQMTFTSGRELVGDISTGTNDDVGGVERRRK